MFSMLVENALPKRLAVYVRRLACPSARVQIRTVGGDYNVTRSRANRSMTVLNFRGLPALHTAGRFSKSERQYRHAPAHHSILATVEFVVLRSIPKTRTGILRCCTGPSALFRRARDPMA
jgi:hypothetical protein